MTRLLKKAKSALLAEFIDKNERKLFRAMNDL